MISRGDTMPMNYDEETLIETGEWRFRKKEENETVESYRVAFAKKAVEKAFRVRSM